MKKRGIFLLSLLLAAILCLQTAPAVMAADSEAGGVFFDFSIKDKTSLLSGCSEFFMAYLFLK